MSHYCWPNHLHGENLHSDNTGHKTCRDFSRNFLKGVGRLIEKQAHKCMRPKACSSMLRDLHWVLVNIFTLTSMWAAAVHICMCSIHILKEGKTAMKCKIMDRLKHDKLDHMHTQTHTYNFAHLQI